MDIFTLFKDPTILISFVIMLIFKIFPPKSINSWYGYRTPRSMKNQEQWEFAQKYSANLAVIVLAILLIIQYLLCTFYPFSVTTRLTSLGLFLVGMVLMIVAVERKLKKREQ